MGRVTFVDTRTDKTLDCTLNEFIQDGMREAEERFALDDRICVEALAKINRDSDDVDDQLDAYDRLVRDRFMEDFQGNWNAYSEDWPSPRGVEPIFKVIEVL